MVSSEPVSSCNLPMAQDMPGMLTASAITVPMAATAAEDSQMLPVISRFTVPRVHIRRAVLPSCRGNSTQ